jgi:hypothetical protein
VQVLDPSLDHPAVLDLLRIWPTPEALRHLAPVTWRFGTSIRGDHPSRKGNKVLKRALLLSAFAALKGPSSRAYCDRKRAEGKRPNQALIALARRRCETPTQFLEKAPTNEPRNARSRLTKTIEAPRGARARRIDAVRLSDASETPPGR